MSVPTGEGERYPACKRCGKRDVWVGGKGRGRCFACWDKSPLVWIRRGLVVVVALGALVALVLSQRGASTQRSEQKRIDGVCKAYLVRSYDALGAANGDPNRLPKDTPPPECAKAHLGNFNPDNPGN